MLVLIPAGIGTLIELWKCKKILKIEVTMSGFHVRTNYENESIAKEENRTKEVDKEAMKYLSYVLYPLCICGAVYSLIYQPHKRYYIYSYKDQLRSIFDLIFLQLVLLDVEFSC